MRWSALLLPRPDDASPSIDAALQALAVWALQFTPRVAVADEAVVMEVAGSVRLWGGWRALTERVWTEGQELGVRQLAWAPNSLAALALARAGVQNGLPHSPTQPLASLLDALPLHTLSAARPHAVTLAHIGCLTLGDLRTLPRGGVARRFDKQLLHALDQAYGLAPEIHQWIELPETFDARLELMHRVEDASALLFGARRLLLQLCGWLSARHSGVTAFTLHWAHDAMRSRSVGEGDRWTVRTAQPMRDVEHLSRLLAEHLARVELAAPVGDLRLTADEVHKLQPTSHSLLPDSVRQGETLHLVLERLAARLGPERVLRPLLAEDHRPEWMCRWQAAPLALPRKSIPGPEGPQPTFVLPQPLKLAMRGNRPLYQGELLLLAGPQRIEGGWWDRIETADAEQPGHTRNVTRDYWVALSEHAGVLWVFQTRLDEAPAWYLHGHFA
ncbi:DNA polymerase Y family protein [Hydrogenophaga sp.]|uniref:Y-family DNA polymerase n=1 Tax=Hydrogenophaga sp. TaxID=1904254 RepID=UPI0025BE14EA|nr:DNA polymerase Y family protein [Hydrogenophaga sp.]